MSIPHNDSLIIRTWFEIAAHALEARASDIHVEAYPLETQVRIRVDGLLRIQSKHPIEFHECLITRIKILARLDIAEKHIPQDGRLSISCDFFRPDVDYRVSALPTLHSEKAVIRILPNRLEESNLESIGLLSEQLEILRNAIAKPNGLILVTGPTGSESHEHSIVA